ncbi:hypothetical protein Pla22_42880 [Rubripirellula amarantea]|uniref:Uncharacterized protein n=1 Tax=Rubripirellula amarantea TaxID=2527999 RepID=A0A5C5WDS0_9BACT|nr:hypothetical protein [Rubripirellula amarantea]TWT49096.1 hypothetical protein Pla22_42880 [Rubripirellula amarantea]
MARKSRPKNRNNAAASKKKPSVAQTVASELPAPSEAAPSEATPLHTAQAEPAQVEPAQVEPEQVEATQAETLQAEPLQADAASPESTSVIDAIGNNTRLIERLLEQVASLESRSSVPPFASESNEDLLAEIAAANDEIAELQHRNEHLLAERGKLVSDLQARDARISELQQQSEDLAKRAAHTHVNQAVATNQSGSVDALSWEERKQLILRQMEEDTFDAERFVESLSGGTDGAEEAEPKTAEELISDLIDQLEQSERELAARNDEIGELKALLQNQSETRDSGVAIGAAAIAQMVDSDELVMQERERLQMLQDQWEEKFRACEIEASLERAKLSRERQEVSRMNEELQDQLAQLRRNEKQDEETGGATSRRWFAKLGLSDDAS